MTLELIDAFTIAAVEDVHPLGLERDAAAMLLVESDAGRAAAERRAGRGRGGLRAAGATLGRPRADEREADWLRQARRPAHPALERAGVARMEDVGVPRGRVPELLVAIEARPTEQGVRVATFGHAGDGNLHPNFIFDHDDPRAEAS